MSLQARLDAFKVGFEAACTQFYNLAEGEYCE